MKNGLLDEIACKNKRYISDLRLFPELSKELPLKLVSTEQWNGIVDLVYERR